MYTNKEEFKIGDLVRSINYPRDSFGIIISIRAIGKRICGGSRKEAHVHWFKHPGNIFKEADLCPLGSYPVSCLLKIKK